MLTLLADLPDGVVGVEAHGKVTSEDYEKLLVPPSKRHAIHGLGWIMPGEFKVFELEELDAAREWVTSEPPHVERLY